VWRTWFDRGDNLYHYFGDFVYWNDFEQVVELAFVFHIQAFCHLQLLMDSDLVVWAKLLEPVIHFSQTGGDGFDL
jgi:hypothetical protein